MNRRGTSRRCSCKTVRRHRDTERPLADIKRYLREVVGRSCAAGSLRACEVFFDLPGLCCTSARCPDRPERVAGDLPAQSLAALSRSTARATTRGDASDVSGGHRPRINPRSRPSIFPSRGIDSEVANLAYPKCRIVMLWTPFALALPSGLPLVCGKTASSPAPSLARAPPASAGRTVRSAMWRWSNRPGSLSPAVRLLAGVRNGLWPQ